MTIGARARTVARRWRRRLRPASAPAIDRAPPTCPPGWQVGPPDFVGVGVQRAGTTWWYDELARHPDVHRAPGVPKEIHFFDGCSDRNLDDADVARYHRWFPRPPGGIAGEWTPCYAYHPWEAALLARAAPATRVLLLLRDPVDRFRSGLRFRLDRGWSHSDAVTDAFGRSLYAGQVARLLDHVSPDRLLVLTYEGARAAPSATRDRTARFLGLDPDRFPGPVEVRAPSGWTSDRHGDLPTALVGELTARSRDDLAELARLLPDLDVGPWPTAAHA